MNKIKLGMICGGVSTEHEISIKSYLSILKNINKEKYDIYSIYISKEGIWHHIIKPNENIKEMDLETIENIPNTLKKLDIVFPILHGKNGEDGTIQGMLELLNIPYVGCGILASAVSMDKVYTKTLMNNANILQANYFSIKKKNNNYIIIDKSLKEESISLDRIDNIIKETLQYPVFIKPSKSGSSVGVSKVKNKQELKEGIDNALQYDSKILIEEAIIGKEVECAILETDEVLASTVGEIQQQEEFYSYDAKYKSKESKTIIPAQLEEEVINKIRELAIRIFKIVSGNTLARVDFFVDKENKIYFNEINTMPGFTNISMYPMLWEESGISYKELLDKIIDSAR